MTESKHIGKIGKVVELRLQNKTWGEVAIEANIPERSLYNLRHSEGFLEVANSIWLDIWSDIKKQRGIDQNYNLNEAIKNQFKMFQLLSGTSLEGLIGSEVKSMGCSPECQFYPQHTMDKRVESEHIINHVLQLTDEQVNRWAAYLEEHGESEYPEAVKE